MTDREPYFAELETALKAADFTQPTLVIDKDRLDGNLSVFRSTVAADMDVRVVAKSLPCDALLRHVLGSLGTQRLMTFNVPMLLEIARTMPAAHQLLGKPLSVAAARQFYIAMNREQSNVTWLIDTTARLTQYETLAQDLGHVFQVSIELDVGLHRGGFSPDQTLRSALEQILRSPHLSFGGFMGYEAHLAKIPTVAGARDRAFTRVTNTYAAANIIAADVCGEGATEAVRNTGGSLTYRLHRDTTIADEVSVGSVLLKGTDFDTDLLTDFTPALFVATPIVKVLDETVLPGLEFMERVTQRVRPGRAKTLFIHGGHWLADPVDPPGASYNALYGRSSNQEMLNVPSSSLVEPDDFAFLRPTQTEAVLLQFGDIAIYTDGSITESWTPYPPST